VTSWLGILRLSASIGAPFGCPLYDGIGPAIKS
jgi:hypothetical protein